MKVMKFGGTSVGKAERMKEVAGLITSDKEPKIVVLSALSGTTNALTEISSYLAVNDRDSARKKIDELESHYKNFIEQLLSDKSAIAKAHSTIAEHFEFLNIILKISYSEALNKDILAQGELLSTRLFAHYLAEQNISHQLIPALDFMTLDNHHEPNIESIKDKLLKILKSNEQNGIFITQGYITKNAKGEVDNLKRGGSDYSASLIAAAINASVCEIWTDIDGMHNNDPRIVKETRPIEQLSFDEAAELAYFGAKILHPASIWPAQQYNIPVKLLNTMDPSAKGTTISRFPAGTGVKAVAAKDNITAIRIKSSRMLLAHGFLRKVFEVFEKFRTSIDMITTSEVAVSLTIDSDIYLNDIIKELNEIAYVEVDSGLTIIAIVGNEITETKEVLTRIFTSLNNIPVRMVSYGGSPHNISILVPSGMKNKSLEALSGGLFDN